MESKKDGKDQKTIQSSTTPDPGYHMGNEQKYNNISSKSQEVSLFPADDHEVPMNRCESTRNTSHKNTNDPQKKYRLGTVSENVLLEECSYSNYYECSGWGNLTKLPPVQKNLSFNDISSLRMCRIVPIFFFKTGFNSCTHSGIVTLQAFTVDCVIFKKILYLDLTS